MLPIHQLWELVPAKLRCRNETDELHFNQAPTRGRPHLTVCRT
jgi:hypothetical protein